MNQKKTGSRPGWLLILAACSILGGVFLYLALQSFEVWQAIGGSLASDGDLEVLTPELFQSLQKLVSAAGIVLFVLAAGMLIMPVESQELLQRIGMSIRSLVKRFPADWRTFWRQLASWPNHRTDRWIILGLMLLSVAARAALLDRPMLHDESYTVEAWAAGSVSNLLEDYHLPNNHIFHTLLVSILIKTFGVQPWIVRLPAFIAIALLVPSSYGLARRWFSRGAGILAAVVIAFAPVFSLYASNARGYPLYMLFTVLLFWLSACLMRQNNLFEWLLWIVIGALGFWTVPMMLYPFGAVCVWILLAAFFDRQAVQAYGRQLRLIKYLMSSGLMTVFLVTLAYMPVLYRSGTRYLFHNSFIEPLSFAEFWPTLFESRLPETWREFTLGLGGVLPWLLAVGILVSLVLKRHYSPYPVHALAALAIWVIPLLLLRRPNGWARVWSYLYPLALIWAAAGWTRLTRLVPSRWFDLARWRRWLAPSAIGLVTVWVLVLGLRWNLSTCPDFRCQTGLEEQVVEMLVPTISVSDLIMVKSPSDSSIWYYFRQNGMSNAYFQKDRQFGRAIFIVQPDTGETIGSLIADYGMDEAWFDSTSLQEMFSIDRLEVFEVKVRPGVNTITGEGI